jgi:ComF family protein
MNIFGAVLDLLFPPKCPFCRRVVDGSGVCGACEKSLPWTRGTENLRTGADELFCAAPLFYEGVVRDTLLRLKFHGADHLARSLGELLARCAAEQFAGEFDVVTWVPVGPKRLKKRGYDQARLLAESGCRLWKTAPERLLVKTGDNPAQSGLVDAAARRANVLGMYEIAPGARVAGRRILLIDDICTTGSTLTECVRTLRNGGAEQVVCAAVARTRPVRDVQPGGTENC